VLDVKDLTVHYGAIAALRDVSITTSAGEIVGVIGPNGAGKSTLVMAIAGALAPTRGTVTLDGADLGGRPPEERSRRGIAVVPERRRIFSGLSVGENLQVAALAYGDEGAARIEAMLDRFPVLRSRFRQSAAQLSGGEQQQLAVARALVTGPRLLLVDEPSIGLAPRMVDAIFEVLSELRSDGVTILLVEQHVHRTVTLADRTYVLRNGAIAFEGRGRAVLDDYDAAEAYLSDAAGTRERRSE
jgi:branched-chain amino acid transport system ATP-binding protein